MTQLTENLTVWELWYFKAVNQLPWRAFSSSYSPCNCYSPDRRVQSGSYSPPEISTHLWRVGERLFPTLLIHGPYHEIHGKKSPHLWKSLGSMHMGHRPFPPSLPISYPRPFPASLPISYPRPFPPSLPIFYPRPLRAKKETTKNMWTVPVIPKGTYLFTRKIVDINLPTCIKMLSAYYWL